MIRWTFQDTDGLSWTLFPAPGDEGDQVLLGDAVLAPDHMNMQFAGCDGAADRFDGQRQAYLATLATVNMRGTGETGFIFSTLLSIGGERCVGGPETFRGCLATEQVRRAA